MAQAVRGCVAQGRTLLISCATIAAVSSGVPPAAIAVIRISGPLAISVATTIAGTLPPPRQAALRALRDVTGELLDRALVLQFPGPDSATGEDLVEFHCHGGRAVVEAVERVLYAVPGVRQAEPGEFTRRALEHGRIDLTEAEGLADLLEAETETQRRAALAAAEGQVSRAIRGWMEQTAMLSARVEAAIDYGDEGDAAIEAESLDGVLADMTALKGEIDSMLAFPAVERWRDGIRVIVAGPPNAGKSTLVNMLSGRDAAIVSAIAGTTRDLIEVSIRRNGVGYVLIDTAGVHGDSSDVIERQGMARASDAMATADIVLWLGDEAPADTAPTLWIHSKADMPGRERAPDGAVATISANDLGSHQAVWRLIEQRSSDRLPSGSIRFHRRHRLACSEAADMMIPGCHDLVLLAERLRVAHRHFAAALGLNATDMMLDALFSRFCVGK